MDNSPRLNLPYLAPAQAQKHVTVNEALARLDGVVHLALQSLTDTSPPALPDEGDSYGLPVGATNEWAGNDGYVATFMNGGWVYANPSTGWRAYVIDQASEARFLNDDWQLNNVVRSESGAASKMRILEFDHVIDPGNSSQTSVNIPAGAMVFGATGIVVQDITGALGDWSLGINGSPTQFGSGLGTGNGSWIRGMLGSPTTYYSATPLVLTANGGDFAGGIVRLSLHILEIDYPAI